MYIGKLSPQAYVRSNNFSNLTPENKEFEVMPRAKWFFYLYSGVALPKLPPHVWACALSVKNEEVDDFQDKQHAAFIVTDFVCRPEDGENGTHFVCYRSFKTKTFMCNDDKIRLQTRNLYYYFRNPQYLADETRDITLRVLLYRRATEVHEQLEAARRKPLLNYEQQISAQSETEAKSVERLKLLEWCSAIKSRNLNLKKQLKTKTKIIDDFVGNIFDLQINIKEYNEKDKASSAEANAARVEQRQRMQEIDDHLDKANSIYNALSSRSASDDETSSEYLSVDDTGGDDASVDETGGDDASVDETRGDDASQDNGFTQILIPFCEQNFNVWALLVVTQANNTLFLPAQTTHETNVEHILEEISGVDHSWAQAQTRECHVHNCVFKAEHSAAGVGTLMDIISVLPDSYNRQNPSAWLFYDELDDEHFRKRFWYLNESGLQDEWIF